MGYARWVNCVNGAQIKDSGALRPIEYRHTGDIQNLSIDKNGFLLTINMSTKKAASPPWVAAFGLQTHYRNGKSWSFLSEINERYFFRFSDILAVCLCGHNKGEVCQQYAGGKRFVAILSGTRIRLQFSVLKKTTKVGCSNS